MGRLHLPSKSAAGLMSFRTTTVLLAKLRDMIGPGLCEQNLHIYVDE